jgi:alpha-amylase/alpha-mannosidase (GH57 family)
MSVSFCIHGHFYQPPRENPWLGAIPVEASAAPMRHWNERILRESYAPLAFARRLDGNGRIADILNCYAWINFNAGPTLLHWMRRDAPETLARMREGDAAGKIRWGRGNAMAQIYHHVIMPLATREERELEIRWAIDDFRFHFGRDPEGMWLSECAADIPTLESLAAHGITFVILAPRQAKAVIVDGARREVSGGTVNVGEPYRVALPSGASITAVFYDGGLSQAIAFEGLLGNGETFWQRISAAAAALAEKNAGRALLTIATDGETYGHHFTFGEMALAHVLAQGYSGRDGLALTNLAAYIADNPPVHQAEIHAPSSWSCVHGVERWRSDCGCTDGGHPGWNQNWRRPLRFALDRMREAVRGHFAVAGQNCFTDPAGALAAYGEVLADPNRSDAFAARWFTGDAAAQDRAWKLLAMQEQSLAAYASCAWFFDDIGRIEPENALTFALRALDLARETGGSGETAAMEKELVHALSNQPGLGTGRDVFLREVLPRREDAASLSLMAWTLLASQGGLPEPGRSARHDWPELSLEFTAGEEREKDEQQGLAVIRSRHERLGSRHAWTFSPGPPARAVGSSFVPHAEATMRVRPDRPDDDVGRGEEKSRSVRDLSRPARDALLTLCLENREKILAPELQAAAGHAASLLSPRAEGQNDLTRPELWGTFLPYLARECMENDAIDAERILVAAQILARHLTAAQAALARDMARESLLAALDDAAAPGRSPQSGQTPRTPRSLDDAALAARARKARGLLPGMDWWAVQNRLWELGAHAFPLLAAELGFR